MNTHHNYSVISKDKYDYLEGLFDRYGDENSTIFFQDFKEIVYKSKLLEKEKIGKLIDQIGREMRDKMMSTTDSQIKISKKNLINIGKREFFDHMNYLFFENNKINNEKDPELSKTLYKYLKRIYLIFYLGKNLLLLRIT